MGHVQDLEPWAAGLCGLIMQNERVRYVMTEAVLSIDIREPVTEAIRLFAEYPLHHLPVVDGLELKGMLSSADMLKLESFLPGGSASRSATVLAERFKIESMMRRPVWTAVPGDTIAVAASRMATHGIHALPVVDGSNHLIGIVTTTDIMHALLHGVKRGNFEPQAARGKPAELASLHAIRAAESAVRNAADPHGVAGSLLYLHERSRLLEKLREDVARYLNCGQAEQLHSLLLRDLERLDSNTSLPERL